MRTSFATVCLILLAVALGLPTPNALTPFTRSSILDALLAAEDPFRLPDPPLLAVPNSASDSLLARADWKETPKAHIISLDIPGIRRDDVKIEVEEGRVLRVSGERRSEEEAEGEKWHRAERPSGKFWRRFRLPWNADIERIGAQMESGVLRITVPKLAEHLKKREARVVEIVEAADKGGEDVKASKAEI
ncbi:hypothetical protein KFK09_024390 [Dendrobium nobile]|uniref:SHSP domain-containing protein n=1 Tax=Dendrobium nobile TaxID=94219 RepID=A0A8T3ADQ1_DENNO|nr:hypothetical protein KFK09_024390 [Dendrobium nobile]